MTFFTSAHEKYLWSYALIVIVAIFSTLFIGQPLTEYYSNQDLQAAVFLIVLILVGASILIHAFNTKPARIELVVWIGIAAVYLMLILRLGLPERSHLVEYSVLAIFIHMAVVERMGVANQMLKPALIAFLISFLISLCDEWLQIFIPDRVFDKKDILFNGLAIAMAIGSRISVSLIRKLKTK